MGARATRHDLTYSQQLVPFVLNLHFLSAWNTEARPLRQSASSQNPTSLRFFFFLGHQKVPSFLFLREPTNHQKLLRGPDTPLRLALRSDRLPSHLDILIHLFKKQNPKRTPQEQELSPPRAAEVEHTPPDVVNLREKQIVFLFQSLALLGFSLSQIIRRLPID